MHPCWVYSLLSTLSSLPFWSVPPPIPVHPLGLPPRFGPCPVSLLPLSTLPLGHFIQSHGFNYQVGDLASNQTSPRERQPQVSTLVLSTYAWSHNDLKLNIFTRKRYYLTFQMCFPPKLPILSIGTTILPVQPHQKSESSCPLTISHYPRMPPPINSPCPCPVPHDLSLTSHPSKFRPS